MVHRKGRWKSSEHDECMYCCRAEDGRIAVLVTYVDDILLAGDYEEEVQGMVNYPMKRCEGQDLGVADRLLGVALIFTDKGTKLDQAPYTKSIIIKGMGSCDRRKVSTPLDTGSITQARERSRTGQLDSFLCENLGRSCSWRE